MSVRVLENSNDKIIFDKERAYSVLESVVGNIPNEFFQ